MSFEDHEVHEDEDGEFIFVRKFWHRHAKRWVFPTGGRTAIKIRIRKKRSGR